MSVQGLSPTVTRGSWDKSKMLSMGVFLRDPNPYSREFCREQNKTPKGNWIELTQIQLNSFFFLRV